MAESVSEDYAPTVDGSSRMQQCRSVEEWRSCEQVENGTPSTSPPHWDSDDDDDDDCGQKPSDLYGKFTWKIDHFSQISKRELRSNAFEVGGYKWYILIYPQGCDACNHLSLFLCVADHDKLLPGWSYFALFTIAVVNKDSKKNKYNDTLHRFCKKEHDWGWKKFMEINKVNEGFVDDDSLTIKAQVQVIRGKVDRPFRCLDCQYRRELIRVYLAGVEKTFAEFVKERKKKLQTLIGDKAKRSSFQSFWLGIDQNTRRYMSRDKRDAVLRVIVRQFFIEKEVLSTLIMDSLYSGLRTLESQSKRKKMRGTLLVEEGLPASASAPAPAPIISIENDMFVLADDVFRLLERASLEFSQPSLPSKEEKGLPTRVKEGCSGEELNRDSVLRDEKRLTELGRRTLEIFALAHIFSRIERAYQDAVALKRQEELIREEEEAEQAENMKREKKAKKKQARQRRNTRKSKDREKVQKSAEMQKETHQTQDSLSNGRILEDFSENSQLANEKRNLREDVSDVSEPGDDDRETAQHNVEDKDSGPHWVADKLEVHPTNVTCRGEAADEQKRSSSVLDDSSSTCSTDSIPSVVVNGPYRGKSSYNKNKRGSTSRGKAQQNKEVQNDSSMSIDRLLYASESCSAHRPETDGQICSSEDHIQMREQQLSKKEVEVGMTVEKEMSVKHQSEEELLVNSRKSPPPLPSYGNYTGKLLPAKEPKERHTIITSTNIQVSIPEPTSAAPIHGSVKSAGNLSVSIFESYSAQTKTSHTHQEQEPISRPSSAPVIHAPKETVFVDSTSHTVPQLSSRTLCSINHVDSGPPSPQTFEPQSYRNAMMGIGTTPGAGIAGRTVSSATQCATSSWAPLSSSSVHTQQTVWSDRPSVASGSLHNQHQWTDKSHSHVRDTVHIAFNSESQVLMPDEFPHLDIINDLLDDDHLRNGRRAAAFNGYPSHDNFHSMNQQYVDPSSGSNQLDLQDYNCGQLSQMIYDSFAPSHVFGDPSVVDFPVYGNDLHAMFQNQWPSSTVDANGYQLPEYLLCGLGGYNIMYQHANGI